jgi:hypothetical protein
MVVQPCERSVMWTAKEDLELTMLNLILFVLNAEQQILMKMW